MAIVLDGKSLADRICTELKTTVDDLKSKNCVYPKLIIVTSGNNDAGNLYVNNKKKRCEEIGIDCQIIHFDTLSCYNVIQLRNNTNAPIIFQSPITATDGNDKQIWTTLDTLLSYDRDVDGFVSPTNLGRLVKNIDNFYMTPCTPAGIMDLLHEYNIELEEKTVCIIGRSNLVGKPLFHMMEHNGATCILCHSKTPKHNLRYFANMSDVIVSATGVRNILLKSEFADTSNKIFIDVGMNRNENGKLCGDLDPEIFEDCYAYTPVPGGVGPMTVAKLMENTVNFYKLMKSFKKG